VTTTAPAPEPVIPAALAAAMRREGHVVITRAVRAADGSRYDLVDIVPAYRVMPEATA
jgi:hypothetical protein